MKKETVDFKSIMTTKKRKAIEIVDLFENLLADKDIKIPCAFRGEEEDRNELDSDGNRTDACLYGSEYYQLVDDVEAILEDM